MGEEHKQKYRIVMRRRDEKERMMKRERAGDEERDKAKDRGNFMVGQREEGKKQEKDKRCRDGEKQCKAEGIN